MHQHSLIHFFTQPFFIAAIGAECGIRVTVSAILSEGLLGCSIMLEINPYLFPTEKAKNRIHYLSSLSGHILQWFEPLRHQDGTIINFPLQFLSHLNRGADGIFNWGGAQSVNHYSERDGKQLTIANGCLLHFSTYNFTYHINRARRDD